MLAAENRHRLNTEYPIHRELEELREAQLVIRAGEQAFLPPTPKAKEEKKVPKEEKEEEEPEEKEEEKEQEEEEEEETEEKRLRVVPLIKELQEKWGILTFHERRSPRGIENPDQGPARQRAARGRGEEASDEEEGEEEEEEEKEEVLAEKGTETVELTLMAAWAEMIGQSGGPGKQALTVDMGPEFVAGKFQTANQEAAQGSSSPLSILTASTTTREASAREHNLKEHYNELMFDPTAHSIITDEQIRHWQLYLQNKTYADPYYTFPNDFIHDCIFHFNSALHREVKGFIQHAIHHIHHNKEHQPNAKLILWQRNLRFRCKVQPFPFSTWRQLIYDAELDDLANSVGFTFREQQL
ncbi:unnamed protein product [Symbiodinium microadriaticum]|nr:unnamed protein product [Symbiodinium microadriaticum]